MAEYTYADVIIDPEDPRVEIGKEYYAATSISSALRAANVGNESLLVKLDSVNREPTRTLITSKPFTVSYKHGNGGDTDFIIRKKEPEKRYVPFDLSKEEDREKLRGKWIKSEEREAMITAFHTLPDGKWTADCSNFINSTADGLLRFYTFIDSSPCGKLVKVE